MELARAVDSAILYLSSFWNTEASDLSGTEESRNLSEDLTIEILVKLPVKSLLRFRCVCKSWFHLIKSPNFVKRHLNHHKNNDNIIVLSERLFRRGEVISFHSYARPGRGISLLSYEPVSVITPHLEISEYDFKELPDSVCGTCDGLLCFSSEWSNTIILCNPAMREFKQLPPFPFRFPKALGFGFDSDKNDYKVIVILDFGKKAIVYSLSANTWRQIDFDIGWISFGFYFGTLFNGTVHWVEFQGDKVILFDMNTEVFSEMKLPYIDPEEDIMKRLMVLNGSLALFTYKFQKQSQFINIWVMHEYGVTESWTKQHIIGPITELLHPFFLWKNEAIVFEDYGADMFSVSLYTHKKKSFCIRGIPGVVFLAAVYQESLISIK